MTTTVETVSTRITKSWQQGKYPLVIRQLAKLPRDVVLETLYQIADKIVRLKTALGILKRQ